MEEIKYDLEYLCLSKLKVLWQESQRPLNERWKNEIRDNFDPDLWSPPDVTKPNGKGEFHIIDGQHRIAAAREALGEGQTVPCRVYDFDDPSKAAGMWHRINEKRKRPHPVDMFNVKVTAGSKNEVAVNSIVLNNGYHVGMTGPSRLSCPSALVYVYVRYQAAVLNETIRTIAAIYGSTEAMVANNIKGFAAFLSEYRLANHGRLVKNVKRIYPDHGQLAAAVKQHKDLTNIAGSEKAVMAVLWAAYNRGGGPKLKPAS